MTDAAPDTNPVRCPGCGKGHRWLQEYAGMRVRCSRCQGPMVMPFEPPSPMREPLPTERAAAQAAPPPLEPVGDDAPPILMDDDSNNTEDSGLKLLDDSAPVLKPKAKPAPPRQPILDSKADTVFETQIPLDGAAQASTAKQPDPYELDIPDEIESGETVAQRTCPNCGVNIHADTVICVSCGTNLETGQTASIETGVDERSKPPAPAPGSAPAGTSAKGILENRPMLAALGAEARRDDDTPNFALMDIYVPVGCIIAGVLMVLFDVFVVLDVSLHVDDLVTSEGKVRMFFLLRHAVSVVFQVPFLFAGIFVIGMFFGTSFSSWTEVILKLIAVSVFLTGFGGCVDSFVDRITEGAGWFMWYVTAAINLGAFWIISAKLFDLDAVEVMILWFVAFFAPMFGVVMFFTMAYATLFA